MPSSNLSMKPLRNNLIVKIDESLPTIAGIYLPNTVEKWRESKDQIGNRGIVVAVGAGKRHQKTGIKCLAQCKVGDIVRFSELEYPKIDNDHIVISDMDIVGIES